MVDESRIINTLGKMAYYLGSHNSICVSVSGGSDSDVIVHMIATHFREFLPKIHFVFANTGLEYQATLRHLDEMEKLYDIKIDRERGMPIPAVVKKYGVPFLSKQVSEYVARLQRHNFLWEDSLLEKLKEKYKKCLVALRWWCNDWGEKSRFNIDWNKLLKPFLIKEKPDIKISNMCCQKSKKDPLIKYEKKHKCDLVITGERKSEGGARAGKSNCFEKSHGYDHYMPLYFWNDEAKQKYIADSYLAHQRGEGHYCFHSDCYGVYGLKRTGCVGCPFAKDRKQELEIMQKYEPKLYKACMCVFGKSYALMDKYEEFKRRG